MKPTTWHIWGGALALAMLLLVAACDTGVGSSPDPGVFQLVLQADPADNVIVVGNNRYVLGGGGDAEGSIRAEARDARLYRDSTYSLLLPSLRSFSTEGLTVDLLELADGGGYREHVLYETYLAPAVYDSLKLRLDITSFAVSQVRLDTVEVPIGDTTRTRVRRNVVSFENEVELAPGVDPVRTFVEDVQITTGDTTVMRLRIRPLQSLTRFKDTYYFTPNIEITDVQHRGGR